MEFQIHAIPPIEHGSSPHPCLHPSPVGKLQQQHLVVAVVLEVDDRRLAVGSRSSDDPLGADDHPYGSLDRSVDREASKVGLDHPVFSYPFDRQTLPEERRHPRVGGSLVDVEWTTHLDDVAVAHHRNGVGDGERLRLIVGDEHGSGAGVAQDPAYVPAHPITVRCIEVREWFIEQYHLWPRRQGAGQGHPLLLSAGELAGEAVVHPGQSDKVEDLGDAFDTVLLGDPVPNVVGDGHMREQRVVLEHHPDPALLGRDVDTLTEDGPTTDRHRSCIRRLEPGDGSQRRGLPASGRADQADHLSLVDHKTEVVQRHRVSVCLEQPTAFDRRAGFGHPGDSLVLRTRK